MKKLKLIILDSALKKYIGDEADLYPDDNANFIDALKEIDIRTKDKFPIEDYPEYKSFLHMFWNPIKERFYKGIVLTAFTKNRSFYNLRSKVMDVLPDDLTVHLGLGLCKSEGEPIVPYEEFHERMKT